jgi:hypothetical protein
VVQRLPPRPERLPLLEGISWFDRDPYALDPLEMLRRYETGWRHVGALAEPSAEELEYIRALAAVFGSTLDVPA